MHEEQNMRSQIKEKKNNSGTETNRTLRYLVSFLVIMGLLVVLFFWNIGVGSVEMSFFDFLGVLTKHQPDSTLYQIVWKSVCPVSLLQFCSEGHFPYPVSCCRVFSRIRLQDRMCLGFPPEPNLSWH